LAVPGQATVGIYEKQENFKNPIYMVKMQFKRRPTNDSGI
jgi:hypothetical protein